MPVVIDINEKTLDLAPVRESVDRLLRPEGGFAVWFQKLPGMAYAGGYDPAEISASSFVELARELRA